MVLVWVAAAPLASGATESCEFKVVNWNASGMASNAGMDVPVAETVMAFIGSYDANVATLQEVTDASLLHIEAELPDWDCQWASFGVDNIAVCVKGVGTNFFAAPLGDYTAEKNCDPPPAAPWWGYAQLEYEGVLVTSVHTRSCWDNQHVDELHRNVTTGIVAGDFNFWTPEIPGWYQTDLDLEWTIEDDRNEDELLDKIDHVLSVEEPEFVSGDAAGDGDPVEKFGSNHRVVLGEVRYPPEAPDVVVVATNSDQPLVMDESCAATLEFEIDLHDDCCLDPDDLGLQVTASNLEANATLGAVVVDSVTAMGPRDVVVTGHVEVSAVTGCPASVVIDATAQDCAGNVGDTVTQGSGDSIEVVDETPPEIEPGSGDLLCLWPPNHAYVCFETSDFDPGVTDNCAADPMWSFVECSSDQPDNGIADGNTVDDCVVADAEQLCARSERAGNVAAGRHYSVVIEAVDECDNVSEATNLGDIHVPRDANPFMECVAP